MIFALFLGAFSTTNNNRDTIVEVIRTGQNITDVIEYASVLTDLPSGQDMLSLAKSLPFPSRSCYNEILFTLNTDCTYLSDELQKLLALRLTKCYYNVTGRLEDYPYQKQEHEQTSAMSSRVYAVYTAMRMHWRSICIFVKQVIFTEEASRSLADILHSMIESQMASIELREEINRTTVALTQTMNAVQAKVEKLLSDYDSMLQIEGLDVNIKSILDYILYAINIVSNGKFYISIALITLLLSIFIPKFAGPALFIAIIVTAADAAIGKFLPWWFKSWARIAFKGVFAALMFAYPVLVLVKCARKKEKQD